MGEVYKARDTRLDRTVAITVLPEHIAADPAAADHALAELESWVEEMTLAAGDRLGSPLSRRWCACPGRFDELRQRVPAN